MKNVSDLELHGTSHKEAPRAAADRLLLAVSLISAVVYLVSEAAPFAGSAIVKSLAVSPLALIAVRTLRNRDGLLLGAALLSSAVGDLLLGIEPERLFVFGLGAFLIAHLLYIALFALNRTHLAATGSNNEAAVAAALLLRTGCGRPFRRGSAAVEPIDPDLASNQLRSRGGVLVRRLIALLIVACTASMSVWLWPDLGDLRIPVLAYICVITGMGVMSLLAGFQSWVVPVGALLFMFSDSLIAVSKFKHPIRYDNYLIWCTYYVGQLCIALGFLRARMTATGPTNPADQRRLGIQDENQQ
jgi:uncharacterized membrane protein YhhN